METLISNKPDVIWFDLSNLGEQFKSLTKNFRDTLHREESPTNTHNISDEYKSQYCDLMSDILSFEND